MNYITKKINELKSVGLRPFVAENQISIIIVGIFIIAFVLRIWEIGNIPGGFSEQELKTVTTIKELSKNNLWLPEGYYNAAYLYLGYLWSKVFGLSVLSLRCLSAIIGGATIVLSYVFISKWFSRKIGIFMALLFSVSSFHIAVSRLILPEVLLPMILLALFVSLTYAYRTKNVWLFGLSGVLAGLGFYTSPAFLLVPFIFIFSGWYFYTKNKRFFTSYKNELFVSIFGFLAVMIPYIVSFSQNPKAYIEFYNFNISFTSLAINISQISTMLFIEGPNNYFFNVGREPLLDPLIFIAAIFGLLFAIMAIARRKYLFLILWFVFFAIYASLKPVLVGTDMLGMLVAIYTFAALIIDYILDRWFETFPLNKRAQLFAIGLISIFFALSMLYNFDKYFVAYKYSNEVKKEFSFPANIPLNNNK